MAGRIASGLQFALASLALLSLHLIHGSTLLLSLLLHLASSFQSGSQRLDSSTLASDELRWRKKRPRHFAVVFVPAARGRFEWKKLSYVPWSQDAVLQGMLEDVTQLVQWCSRLDIQSLQLYDEDGGCRRPIRKPTLADSMRTGLLRRRSDNVETALASISALPNFEKRSSTVYVYERLKIMILSREDGKERFATVAAGLAKAVNAGFVPREEVNVEFLQEKLICKPRTPHLGSAFGPLLIRSNAASTFAEPDLLLVLGGLHLRLRGFPPWHSRLSEI